MTKVIIGAILLGSFIMISCLAGCSSQDTPRNTALRFIRATRYSDRAGFEKTVSFERLILEKEGEGYLSLPNEKKKEELSRFKKKTLDELTSGKLKVLSEMDPQMGEIKVAGEGAEVKVHDKKNKDLAYIFLLSREEGAWKIYRIGKI